MEGLTEADDMVRLLIRAPDQQIDDQIVNCQLDWTVARLKDHLEKVYPSKPVSKNYLSFNFSNPFIDLSWKNMRNW